MTLGRHLIAATRNLKAHALRTFLTMLGIVFGVGAVIAMVAIGAGAEQQALDMIRQLGLENVLIRAVDPAADELEELRRRSPGLTLRDRTALADAVIGVDEAYAVIRHEPHTVLAVGRAIDEVIVLGVEPGHRDVAHLEMRAGRFIDTIDLRRHAQTAVLGEQLAREVFGRVDVLGELVMVDDLWLEIVGLVGGESQAGEVEGVATVAAGRSIFMPLSTARRKLDTDALASPLSEIVIHLDQSQSAKAVADQARAALDILHGGAEDFEIVVPEALLEQSRQTQRLFRLVMASIAGISLLVGGIGIMNIMLASVLERTREIGLRRAVGATRKEIHRLFLVEALALSCIGGLCGVLVGLAMAWLVAASAGWPVKVTLFSVVASTSLAVLVGLFSGVYPARHAASLDPIEALRHE